MGAVVALVSNTPRTMATYVETLIVLSCEGGNAPNVLGLKSGEAVLLSPPTAGACGTHTTGETRGVIVTLAPPRVIAWSCIVTLLQIRSQCLTTTPVFALPKVRGMPALLKIMYPLEIDVLFCVVPREPCAPPNRTITCLQALCPLPN